MAEQTRFFIMKFHLVTGKSMTLCTNVRDEWLRILEMDPEIVTGWSDWLAVWDDTQMTGLEMDAELISRVNFAHVISIQTWSVVR